MKAFSLLELFVSIALIFIVGICAYDVWWNATHNCVKSHTEHIPESTSISMVNNIPMSVYHAAYDTEVCDKWEESND